MENLPPEQYCDHAEYKTIRDTICGMRHKEYTCEKCERTFGSVEEMRKDAKANRPRTSPQ
jgi:hypothetical protein